MLLSDWDIQELNVYSYIFVGGFAGNLEDQGPKIAATTALFSLLGYEPCSPPQKPKTRKKGLLWFRKPEGPYWSAPLGKQFSLPL